MKSIVLLTLAVLTAAACTGASPRTGAGGLPAASATPDPEALARPFGRPAPAPVPRAAAIYIAVIRRLMEERSASRSDAVYVVHGGVPGAGHPRRDPFGPAPRPFPQAVVAGIRLRLEDRLPPIWLVDDGRQALRRPGRPGLVKNGGVLLSLGRIRQAGGEVQVPATLWCGGKCSQWQTYVVSRRNGGWVVTGNAGPVVVS
jgi:hypothetical protein